MLRRPIFCFLILAGIGWLAIAPFFRWGIPSGHDFEFHVFSWMDVLDQWKQGIVYPRWAALAHWGYGEARFIFYPPASWTLGAALGAILPWKIVPGAFCWFVLVAAGLSMYGLARQWLRPPDALFAAAFYAVNPYHLLIIYWRSAYAELLAAVFVPLMVLCLLRLKGDDFRPTWWLSLTLAGAWLSNVPVALMIYYSAAELAALIAVRERSARVLIRAAIAMLLGAGLASFYLVPAIYEQPWVNIAQVLSPGVRPQDNFLFTIISDPDHNRFNLLVSLVALGEFTALALAIWFSRRPAFEKARSENAQFDTKPWTLLSAWGVAAAFVMLPASNLLWEHLPKFRFVQLPFRWLLCLNASLAVLSAMATRSAIEESLSQSPPIRLSAIRCWAARGLPSAGLLAVLLLAGHRIQPPWWDAAKDIQMMSDAFSDGTGYEGTDEYVPVAADSYEINTDLPRVSGDSGAAVSVRIMEWGAETKHFVARADAARNLTVRLFNYPAWRVMVNGRLAETQTSDVTGLMIIPVTAGENDVRIAFVRTPDRTLASALSLLTVIVLVVLWIKTAPQVRARFVGANLGTSPATRKDL